MSFCSETTKVLCSQKNVINYSSCVVVCQVEEIALNMTVLKRWDGSRIWYPNSMINVVPILNVTRSENKWEFFKVSCCIPIHTPIHPPPCPSTHPFTNLSCFPPDCCAFNYLVQQISLARIQSVLSIDASDHLWSCTHVRPCSMHHCSTYQYQW